MMIEIIIPHLKTRYFMNISYDDDVGHIGKVMEKFAGGDAFKMYEPCRRVYLHEGIKVKEAGLATGSRLLLLKASKGRE